MKDVLKQIAAGDKHFVIGSELYSQDVQALATWNAMMDNNAKMIYRPEAHRNARWKAKEVKLDSGDVFVVLNSGTVLHWTVSEWSSFMAIGSIKAQRDSNSSRLDNSLQTHINGNRTVGSFER